MKLYRFAIIFDEYYHNFSLSFPFCGMISKKEIFASISNVWKLGSWKRREAIICSHPFLEKKQPEAFFNIFFLCSFVESRSACYLPIFQRPNNCTYPNLSWWKHSRSSHVPTSTKRPTLCFSNSFLWIYLRFNKTWRVRLCSRRDFLIFSRLGSCVVLMDKKRNFASFWTDAQTKGVRTIEFNLLDFSSSVRLTFNRRRIIFFIVVWETSKTRRLSIIETSAVA